MQDPSTGPLSRFDESLLQDAADVCVPAPQIGPPHRLDDPTFVLDQLEALIVVVGLLGRVVPSPPLELRSEAGRLVANIEVDDAAPRQHHGHLRTWSGQGEVDPSEPQE